MKFQISFPTHIIDRIFFRISPSDDLDIIKQLLEEGELPLKGKSVLSSFQNLGEGGWLLKKESMVSMLSEISQR